MSVNVPIEELADAIADFGGSAYVLVSATDGPPRVTHSLIAVDKGELVVSIGRRAAAALAVNPAVSVLWPATAAQSMSLIVDGEVATAPSADGGELRIRPTGAVRHRPAAG